MNSIVASSTSRADMAEVDAKAIVSHHVSTDPDGHAENLSGWEQIYDQLTAGKFSGELVDVWIGDMQLFRETTTQAVHQIGRSWPSSQSFLLPLKMDGIALWGANGTEQMDMHSAFSLSGSEDLDFRTSRNLDLLVVSLRSETLSSYSTVMEGADISLNTVGQGRQLCRLEKLNELRSYLHALMVTLATTRNVLDHSATRKIIREGVVAALLEAFSTKDSPGRPPRCAVSHSRTVRRAREFVLANTDKPVTIVDLCSVLAVSRRTLQLCFQEVVGQNPIRYLRAVRLNKVRRELREGNVEQMKVQDVAARWGFWHLGHFTTDYRQLFGERPSDTLRKR